MVTARLGRSIPGIGGLTILLVGGAVFVEKAEGFGFVPTSLGRATDVDGLDGVGSGGNSIMVGGGGGSGSGSVGVDVGVGAGVRVGVGVGVGVDESGEGEGRISGRVHVTSTMLLL
ncbi:hypothetical protein PC116_g32956 [Phytophthora cactorum]|nr:hypothetical protein PC116_g32956 [Phytophthora cactorum]